MKTILEALEFCKNNKLYGKNINIALGINKAPESFEDVFNYLRLKK
tara:strand:- start:529 stop:666 length:138 start_codon:yes stop_codon:yes gene_type:complete